VTFTNISSSRNQSLYMTGVSFGSCLCIRSTHSDYTVYLFLIYVCMYIYMCVCVCLYRWH
jgi:hypothetical protein